MSMLTDLQDIFTLLIVGLSSGYYLSLASYTTLRASGELRRTPSSLLILLYCGIVKVLFLHGWHSVPGGVKPTYFIRHGHEVINPPLSDDDFDAAVRLAQAEFDDHRPDVI